MEVRDGTWQVGPAGEVEFRVGDGALELVEVRPAEGWQPQVKHQRPQRLEVEFERGPEEWEFEARYDNGVLQLELEQDLEAAEPGRYEVGDAGSVEIAVEEGILRLVEAAANEGWAMRVEEEPREIEVEFTRGDVEWEFEAELDDGRLEVEIECELVGRFPG